MFAKYDLHAMHTRTVQIRAHSHVHACSEVQRTSTGQPKYTCTPVQHKFRRASSTAAYQPTTVVWYAPQGCKGTPSVVPYGVKRPRSSPATSDCLAPSACLIHTNHAPCSAGQLATALQAQWTGTLQSNVPPHTREHRAMGWPKAAYYWRQRSLEMGNDGLRQSRGLQRATVKITSGPKHEARQG